MLYVLIWVLEAELLRQFRLFIQAYTQAVYRAMYEFLLEASGIMRLVFIQDIWIQIS